MIQNRICHRPPSGVALILVVIVIALLTTAGLSFALLMQQGHQYSREDSYRFQSEAGVQSGAVVLKSFVQLPGAQRRRWSTETGTPEFWAGAFEFTEIDAGTSLSSLSTDSTSWTDSIAEESSNGFTELDTFSDVGMDGSELPADFDLGLPGWVVFEYEPVPEDGTGLPWESTSTPTGGLTSLGDEAPLRFLPTDQCRSLNLQTLLIWEQQGWEISPLLQQACGLTASQSDRLLDWIDSDSDVRPQGAEAEEYASLGLPYGPANQPLQDYHQLALIPGFRLEQIYGKSFLLPNFQEMENAWDDQDLASLGSADSWVDEAEEASFTEEALDAETQRPLIFTLALSVRHQLRDSQGNSQIYLNLANLQQLKEQLSAEFDEELATYLCLGRQYGFQDGHVDQPPEKTTIVTAASVTEPLSEASVPVNSVFQLVNTHVLIPGSEPEGSRLINSPFALNSADPTSTAKLARLLDRTFCRPRRVAEMGRLHYQHRLVSRLPGIGETAAQWLKEQRQALDSLGGDPFTEAGEQSASYWSRQLVQGFLEQQLTRAEAEILVNNTCESSDTYAAWVLGHSGNLEHPVLGRILVEGSAEGPRQLYWQQMYTPPELLNQLAAFLAGDSSSASLPPGFE